jgi:putative flippase GtrA
MKTLFRCAGASLAGVTLEFGLLSLLVSLLHVSYLAAALMAGLAGFFVSFLLNRSWAFDGRHGSAPRQILKHAAVVGGGIALGTLLMWLQVAHLGLPYQVGWLVGGSVVFFAWTFPMQRWFTFAPPLAAPSVLPA